MDEVWESIVSRFSTHVIPNLPHHSQVMSAIQKTLSPDEITGANNILLYGAQGFPTELLWESALCNTVCAGKHYTKKSIVWQKEVTYNETPYFFEVDLSHPQQPKDVDVFAAFLKDIVTHPCVHSGRHIMILKNIERLCTRHNSGALRVLLERFSTNVLFICSTTRFSAIESPLTSRFTCYRVPLATNAELQAILGDGGLNMPGGLSPYLIQNNCRDFYFAIYVCWLAQNMPDIVTKEFCTFHVAVLHECLANKKPSMSDLRTLTSKVCVHDASFAHITEDLLNIMSNNNNRQKYDLVHHAAEIDHMCATTDGYRKPLYVELLLHTAVYGIKQK